MKSFCLLLISIFLSSVVSAQAAFGESENIGSGWHFSLNASMEAVNSDFDNSKWNLVDLPHD